jgi:Acetyltransferase (GNAT) domain
VRGAIRWDARSHGVVWGHGVMYYLMSARSPDTADSGAVNLLIWTALRRAHARGLVTDLDGVTTNGAARFLSGFGGEAKKRLVVRRSRALFGAMQWAKRNILPNDDSFILR